VPDFYDSQAAAEQAAQAQPGEVAIPSPAHQQREQAPSLLAGHAGHAQKTAFPPPLLVPPQRTDAETIVREKVEKAIRSSVAVFIDAERMRIEAETAQIELETENLQVRTIVRECRAALNSRFVGWLSRLTTCARLLER